MEVLWTVLTRVRPVAISEQNISFTDNHKIQLKAVITYILGNGLLKTVILEIN